MSLPNDSTLELLHRAQQWLLAGQQVAIATVIATWGSSPRPTGSLLIVREDSVFEGSVSGGCIEAEVVSVALDVIRTRTPQVLMFGVSKDQAWKRGLACGGKVEIFVEAIQ
ncbi:MAG: hypothetical protein KTR25_10455 [Myxococcales bacterium]|nr:hypothetical protein [Myxococcales bacterium]